MALNEGSTRRESFTFQRDANPYDPQEPMTGRADRCYNRVSTKRRLCTSLRDRIMLYAVTIEPLKAIFFLRAFWRGLFRLELGAIREESTCCAGGRGCPRPRGPGATDEAVAAIKARD